MLSIKSTPEAVSLASLFQMPLGGRVTCDSCVRVLLASLWSWACAKNWLNCYSEHMKQRGGMEAGEEWRQTTCASVQSLCKKIHHTAAAWAAPEEPE